MPGTDTIKLFNVYWYGILLLKIFIYNNTNFMGC
jgi:hypothetical protein